MFTLDVADSVPGIEVAQLGAAERLLVVIELNGGLDGLNTVVPFQTGRYFDLRRGLAVNPAQVLALDSEVGLNAALPALHRRYLSGDVAIVRGVGLVDGDRSHFSGMHRAMSGSAPGELARTGWLGRYLDLAGLGGLGAVSVGTGELPLLLRGERAEATVLPVEGSAPFGADRHQPHDQVTLDAVGSLAGATFGLGFTADQLARRFASAIDRATMVAPVYQPQLAVGRPLVASLEMAARVINLDAGVRIVHVRRYGFDTHSGQAGVDSMLLAELDDAIERFYETLLPQFHSRAALLTLTEFGRRVEANNALGTDHGTSSVWFAVGRRVRGGLYGVQPSVADLDARGDLRVHIDLRSVAADVVSGWLGADDRAVLGASFPRLGLFDNDPGCAPSPLIVSSASDRYQPVQPARLLDTRSGVGAVPAPVGPGRHITLKVAGRAPVPESGVGAVVLNMTATDSTEPGFLTVWPAGEPMPIASNLNFAARDTVANLVITKLGAGGDVNVFNERGSVHVIADVVGWFPTSSPYRALSPSRLVDTRRSFGVAGAIGPGASARVAVAGNGGVPAGAAAAVLNITAASVSAPTYFTVWPSGEAMPTASMLNPMPGRASPNLIVAKLSRDGAIDVFNFAGQAELVVDVFGWFPEHSGFHALTPTRIVDTRSGIGALGRLRDHHVLDVDGLCAGGVPANASAIALNVTVAEPLGGGYLTVWPSGNTLPPTSSLNYVAGSVVPNCVISRVGVGGMISMLSSSGQPHVIADVVGWFE